MSQSPHDVTRWYLNLTKWGEMWNLALSTSRGFVFSHDSSGASTSSRPLSVPLNASSVGLKLSHCMYFKGVTNKRIPSQCVILPPKPPHSFCVALPDRHKSWIWSFASYLNIQASFCVSVCVLLLLSEMYEDVFSACLHVCPFLSPQSSLTKFAESLQEMNNYHTVCHHCHGELDISSLF